MCRDEAAELSKLAPRLVQNNIALVGMLHEEKKEEISDFQPFFKVTHKLFETLLGLQ